MFRIRPTLAFTILALLITSFLGSTARAEPKDPAKDAPKDNGLTAGLVIDKHADSIIVQLDGDDEPTKFLISEGIDKRTAETLKSIFGVDRVRIKYKMDGESRRLVAIEKVVGTPTGVFIGTVLKVYNNFWVAVKPKDGPPDGFALNWPPQKFKESTDILKTLKPGDVVAIKYTTDFERHRIMQIEVKPPVPAK